MRIKIAKSLQNQFALTLRAFMLIIFIFNVIVPSPAAAQAIQPPAGTPAPKSPPERTLPTPEAPSYYHPAQIGQPSAGPAATPAPAKTPPQPARQPLEFQVQADSNAVTINDPLTLTVTVQNNGRFALRNLQFIDQLKNGFAYVPAKNSPVSYNTRNKQIEYTIPIVAIKQTVTFSYQVRITLRNQKSPRGGLQVHTVLLNSVGQSLSTRVPFLVNAVLGGASLPNKSFAAIYQPNGGWHKLGPVSVYLPKGALPADSVLVASPVSRKLAIHGGGRAPMLQYQLRVVRTGHLALASGLQAADDQGTNLIDIADETFDEPAYLTLDLSGVVDLSAIPAGQEVYVVTYDEENLVWVKIPIVDQDPAADTVTVLTDHFSTWGAGIGTSLPQNGANVLLFDQPYTSLFSGAAQYSIPVWMPRGRNGMTPSVSLSYSSGGYNGVLGDVQAPWVGGGWNIDGTEIVRKITTTDAGYGYVDGVDTDGSAAYTLAVNGAKYDLVADTLHPGLYNTKQSSFLYVRRHSPALDGLDNPAPNTGGEWWEVVTTDGTRYRLGWNADAEQLAPMYGYQCATGNPCTTPSGSYATLGYAGKATNLVAMRWRVDRVSDPHGNTMTYTYTEEHPDPLSDVPAFDRASYLSTIDYSGHLKPDQSGYDVDPGYQVQFVTGARSDIGDNGPTTFNIWDNYDTKYLDQIKVCYGVCASGGKVVRTYDLNYHAVSVPSNTNGTLVLDKIAICGGSLSGNPATCSVGFDDISATQSPDILFTYQNMANRAVSGSNDKYTYPRLVSINNGYGGELTYDYENDGRGTNSWYNWRVATATVDSGVTMDNGSSTSAIHGYTYATPVYVDGATALNELVGYTDVTDTTYDSDGSTALRGVKHHFGTADPDTGYELNTQSLDADGTTVLNKTVNTYVNDDSQAPFPGWHYRYLYQVENYVRSAGALGLVSQTRYHHDSSTGNLAYREDFKGTGLYRKEYYEYLPNFDPAVHILDKATRDVLVDATNAIFSDTRSNYNATGDLTLTQRVLILDGQQKTADTSYNYDQYGNQTGACAYTGYGTPGKLPADDAACAAGSTTYDDTLHTYPISSTNALNFTSTTDYLYTLGLPYRSTDPNGWQTLTSYDGLGRTKSTTPPGLSQEGVKYTYPGPADIVAGQPYSIKMQILDQTKTGDDPYRYIWGIYDGLGRILQSQVQNDDTGELLVSDTSFNAQGAAEKQSLPRSISGTGGTWAARDWSYYTLNEYDALGRTTQVTAPGNIVSQTQYDGLTTTSIDPNNHQSVHIADAFGRMAQVNEMNADGSIYATTMYSYDIADRLVNVVDSQNNTTTLEYDLLGRKTAMHDPDMGVWSYVYDPLGNLSSQTDARTCTLAMSYDLLNRLAGKSSSGSGCVSQVSAGFTYGTEPGEIGMRIGMTDGSGSTSWDHSDYGRSVTETRTIGSTTKSSTSTSDWLGRPLTVTYPDADTVSYQYDALGQAASLQSSGQGGQTLAELAYNQMGQLITTRLANGAVISNKYDSENGTYRLLERWACAGAATACPGSSLMDFGYTYDPAGNITQVDDNKLSETIKYQYDILDRLSFAQDEKSGGAYAYRQAYSYDKIGNLLQVDNSADLALNQGNDSLASYKQGGVVPPLRNPAGALPAGHQPALAHDEGDTDTPTPTETATPTVTPTSTITLTPTITPTPSKTSIPCAGSGVTREVWTNISGSTVSSLVTGSNNFNSAPNSAGNLSPLEAPTNQANLYGQRLRALLCVPSDGTYTFWITADDSASLRLNTTKLSSPTEVDWAGLAAGAVQIASVSQATGPREWGLYLTPTPQSAYANQQSAGQSLSAGYYYIEVRMKENSGDDHLAVSWKMNDSSAPVDNDDTYIIHGSSLYAATPMDTATPVFTATSTGSPTRTRTPTATPSITHTFTITPTKTQTPTKSLTPTKTKTPTVTQTFTLTPTAAVVVGLWHFSETSGTAAADSSSSGNDGTLSSGVTHISTGASGYAITLGSTSTYVSVPYASSLQPAGSGLSVSAWVYPTQRTSGMTYTILNKGGSNNDYVLKVGTDGYVRFEMDDLTPNTVAGPQLPLNTWSMVTGVYDKNAGFMRLYVNNVLVSAQSVTGTLAYTNGALYIGYTSSPWLGSMDEVRLYKGALKDGEVSALYATFATPTPVPVDTLTPTPETPTATATNLTEGDNPWGTGDDGNLTVGSGTTFNLSSDHSGSRSCADGVAYAVSSLGSTAAVLAATSTPTPTVTPTPTATPVPCLSPGDEVMLINLQDPTGANYSTGNFEFLRVAYVTGSTVAFTTQKTKFYGTSFHSDAAVGTGANDQKVMLVRVPNYNNVTINGTLTGSGWDGSKYGVLVFRVKGSLGPSTNGGTIHMNAKGYRGSQVAYTLAAESYAANASSRGAGAKGPEQAGPSLPGGGGAYGTDGEDKTSAPGGVAYGEQTLSRIYPGSAGGYGGDTYANPGPAGGNGGGIVYIAGSTINFNGTLSSNGGAGGGTAGGSGAGGSIRIEGGSITLTGATVVANGSATNADGGKGRIAVYDQDSLSGLSANPAAYTSLLNVAPTPIPSPTSIATATPQDWGTGADGDLTINSGTTFNINTDYTGARTCAESTAYSVTTLAANYASLSTALSAACLKAGDEILLINMEGISTQYANTGNYEFLRVGGISGSRVDFASLKTRNYGENAGDDSNIGTGANNQKVMLVRVPNYNNVTVTGTLTGSGWDGLKYGVMAFRVHGTLSGSGTIHMNAKGYRGSQVAYTLAAESYAANASSRGAGAKGPEQAGPSLPGGGGAYGTDGEDKTSAPGGVAYGEQTLSRIYPGSAGGYGGDTYANPGPAGGNGGGIVYIAGSTINFNGTLSSNGGAGGGTAGGSGAGGSIRIEGGSITLTGATVVANGSVTNADGGKGRIAVYYWTSLSGFTPDYSKDLSAATATPTITPTRTATPTKTLTPTVTVASIDSYTKVMLHMEGADASTTFTDDSGKVWTRAGNAQIDTAQYKYGAASGKFDGSGDSIHTADSDDFNFGSGDFTIDFWVRFNALPTSENAVLYSQAVDAGNRIYLGLVDSSGVYHWIFHVDSANTAIINVDSSTTIAAATWYHIAIVRSGSSFMIFQNGIQRGTTVTDTSAIPDFAAVVRISTWDGTNTPFNGWLDDYRVSKGIARWTSNFVPGATSTPTVTPTVTITLTSTPTGAKKLSYTYPTATGTATAARPHAVSSVADLNHPSATPDTYSYDNNGNMSQRTVGGVTTNFKYNADNRLYEIDDASNAAIATFAYDGDGVKVSQTMSGTTTLYFAGGAYEVSGASVKKYYSVGGATILDDGSGLKYILTDQQGSSVAVLNSSGTLLSEQRYLPFGQVRNDLGSSISQTDFGYTGQRSLSSSVAGLVDYHARIYDSSIGRFQQPDLIVSNPAGPQTWNRYAYVSNNPIRFTDPSGHNQCDQIPNETARAACNSNGYGQQQQQDDELKKLEQEQDEWQKEQDTNWESLANKLWKPKSPGSKHSETTTLGFNVAGVWAYTLVTMSNGDAQLFHERGLTAGVGPSVSQTYTASPIYNINSPKDYAGKSVAVDGAAGELVVGQVSAWKSLKGNTWGVSQGGGLAVSLPVPLPWVSVTDAEPVAGASTKFTGFGLLLCRALYGCGR